MARWNAIVWPLVIVLVVAIVHLGIEKLLRRKLLWARNWDYVGVLVAVAGLIFVWWNQPRKLLRVEILSNSPLVTVGSDIRNDLSIVYKGDTVRAVTLILIRIANTGDEPIVPADYASPLILELSPPATFADLTIEETRPNGIELDPQRVETNRMSLGTPLLNSGDQVLVRVLAIDNDSTIKVVSRIAGVKEIEVVTALADKSRYEWITWGPPLVILGLTIALTFLSLDLWRLVRARTNLIRQGTGDPPNQDSPKAPN